MAGTNNASPTSRALSQLGKRPSHSSPMVVDKTPKTKRTKYNCIACDECKKRKLKCIAADDTIQRCAKCISSGSRCTYTPGPRLSKPKKGKNETAAQTHSMLENEQVVMNGRNEISSSQRLQEEVNQLRQRVDYLMHVVHQVQDQVANSHSASSPTSSRSSNSRKNKIHREPPFILPKPQPSSVGQWPNGGSFVTWQITDRPTTLSSSNTNSSSVSNGNGNSLQPAVPKQPQFVGPTRAALGFIIGERSLTRMGIPQEEDEDEEDVEEDNGQEPTSSPVASKSSSLKTEKLGSEESPTKLWQSCTAQELVRLIGVFQEEVESVYPFIEAGRLASQAASILKDLRGESSFISSPGFDGRKLIQQATRRSSLSCNPIDVQMVKVAVATAIVVESPGKVDLGNNLVEPVERPIVRIAQPAICLQQVQLSIMLSIYYFHSDNELLAWRAIGTATRQALEMGLHRRKSLEENFRDPQDRRLAIRVFWCLYVLDRRWSFGTSLPFALNDRDIDPEQPEPDDEFSYLRCMAGYGKLCSRLWEAIPPFGSSHRIPADVVRSLDQLALRWFDSIPPHLQLRPPPLPRSSSMSPLSSRQQQQQQHSNKATNTHHHHSGAAEAESQPRVLIRLRALLYLRGNYIRTLIYRHHLLSPVSISENLQAAWLVVRVAQTSIQALVNLNATSDIYTRQENAFNHFLVSALAVIFLAVCHAPSVFAEPCRNDFVAAVGLVRGLSRHGSISRRLWESIRGLLPRLRRLGMQGIGQRDSGQKQKQEKEHGNNVTLNDSGSNNMIYQNVGELQSHFQGQQQSGMTPVTTASESRHKLPSSPQLHYQQHQQQQAQMLSEEEPVPDMFQMRNDLLTIFDVFGQGQGQKMTLNEQQHSDSNTEHGLAPQHGQQQDHQEQQQQTEHHEGGFQVLDGSTQDVFFRNDGDGEASTGEYWDISMRFQELI